MPEPWISRSLPVCLTCSSPKVSHTTGITYFRAFLPSWFRTLALELVPCILVSSLPDLFLSRWGVIFLTLCALCPEWKITSPNKKAQLCFTTLICTRFYQLKVSLTMVCVLLAVITANHGKRHFELIEPRITPNCIAIHATAIQFVSHIASASASA